MSSTSMLKKAGMAAAAVPIVAMTNIHPAAAAGDYDYNIAYPNCLNGLYIQSNQSGPGGLTAGCPNYSGLVLIKFKYKDAGGEHITAPKYGPTLGGVSMGLPAGSTILRSCHQAGQDGFPWGPAVYIDGNTGAWGWTGTSSCDF